MDNKRVITTLAILVITYFLAGWIISWHSYDAYLNAIKFLTAVIAAGCYWVGSNNK